MNDISRWERKVMLWEGGVAALIGAILTMLMPNIADGYWQWLMPLIIALIVGVVVPFFIRASGIHYRLRITIDVPLPDIRKAAVNCEIIEHLRIEQANKDESVILESEPIKRLLARFFESAKTIVEIEVELGASEGASAEEHIETAYDKIEGMLG